MSHSRWHLSSRFAAARSSDRRTDNAAPTFRAPNCLNSESALQKGPLVADGNWKLSDVHPLQIAVYRLAHWHSTKQAYSSAAEERAESIGTPRARCFAADAAVQTVKVQFLVALHRQDATDA